MSRGQTEYRDRELKVKTNSNTNFIYRRHRQLLLWTGTSHEAPSYTYDPQFTLKLWVISQNGNLSSTQSNSRGDDKISF